MRGKVAAVAVLALLIAAPTAQAQHTSYSTPLTGGTTVATVPSCNGIGPVGVLATGLGLYVSDACNNTLYRFPANGGPPIAQRANGINAGLTVRKNRYYGIANQASLGSAHGIYEFDPITLERGARFAQTPGDERAIATDPITDDFFVTAPYGSGSAIFRIAPTAGSPRITTFKTNGNQFAGIAFETSGKRLFAATNVPFSHALGYSRDGTTLFDMSNCCHGPSGIAPEKLFGGGVPTVLVNSNDGTIEWMRSNTGEPNDRHISASGGTRGDQATVDGAGCMYVTQLSVVERLAPCSFQPGTCTITGTEGGETITGTDGNDVICARGGDDKVIGDGGSDLVLGGAGNDHIDAGAGNNQVHAGDGADKLVGGNGDDTLFGDGGDDQITPGLGNDWVDGGTIDRVDDGRDTAYYGGRTAALTIRLGNNGSAGQAGENDNIRPSIETATGGSGGDELRILFDAKDGLRLNGGGGDDVLYAQFQDDTFDGGPGNDQIYAGGGSDRLYGGDGNDRLEGGDGARDTLEGGAGADHMCACAGAISDQINTRVMYWDRTTPVNVTAGSGDGNDGAPGEGDTVALDVFGVAGGAAADTIVGGPETRDIWGEGGADDITLGRSGGTTARGGTGDDTIRARNTFPGDVLYCQDGTDTFLVDASGDQTIDCETPG